MDVADRYSYRVFYSPEDEAYVGTVAELPSLSHLADTQVEALAGIRDLAEFAVEDLRGHGDHPVPEPFVDRRYSGKFQIRIPAETHRKLAVEAAEQHVSLNRLVAARLS